MSKVMHVLGGAPVSAGTQADIKDNLYMHVNYQWLQNAVIPDDKPDTGSFQELDEEVEKRLINDFNDYHAGKFTAPNDMFTEAMKLHTMVLDVDQRNHDGIRPLLPVINRIKRLRNLDDLRLQLSDWIKSALPLPFIVDIEPDWKNTAKNAVFMYAPSLILPDKTYYAKADSAKLLQSWATMSKQLLMHAGYLENVAQKMVDQALAFDKALVPYVMTSEELADMTKQYNAKTLSEVSAYSNAFDLSKMICELVDDEPDKVIITQPNYFAALDKLVNADTFTNLKSWLLIKTVNTYAPYLSETIRKTADMFHRTVSGIKASLTLDRFAYTVLDDEFKYVIGDFYGRKYFGEKAKANATAMIQEMIGVYKKRLENNTWLGAQTRAKAILKLNKIAIKVGFPEKIKPVYQKLHVTTKRDGGTLLSNYIAIKQVMLADNFEQFHKAVDRSEWDMPPQLVNACYDPSRNDITFPAAILEKPFYDLSQSHSQNFGGIGCVMGHEISHAFDNNGSHFDEYGNMVNWWTDEDAAYFKKLTQKMIDEFDGIPFAGSKVDGKLVVSENIADNGGMSCSLEALKQYDDIDLKAFFINWATIWRMKASTQYKLMLLATDVHAPEELRGNVVPQNFTEFYDAFGIHAGDGMWLDPTKRVQIW